MSSVSLGGGSWSALVRSQTKSLPGFTDWSGERISLPVACARQARWWRLLLARDVSLCLAEW